MYPIHAADPLLECVVTLLRGVPLPVLAVVCFRRQQILKDPLRR
jgi:hypothetical protein